MLIDLHTHSSASDGTDDPAAVVRAAAAAGVRVLALTDHDTTSGWAAADAAADAARVQFVPGIELSTQLAGVAVHLLAYCPDPTHPGLVAELERIRADRTSRAEVMVAKIAEHYPLTWADVQRQVEPGATVGRPHLADAMVALGLVADREEAFATVLHARSPFYVRHYAPDTEALIGVVRAAGGVPVMAHPRAERRGRIVTDDDIARLAAAGLAGLEVDHRDHEPADRAHLRGLAADLGLITTGASDYHGTGKANLIGENSTSPEALATILALAESLAAAE